MLKAKHKDVKVVYKNERAFGIRDKNGFLFFFAELSVRSPEEVGEQIELALFLEKALRNRTEAPNYTPTGKTIFKGG